MELKTIHIGKLRLGYFDVGEGRPLVFFHGFGARIAEKDTWNSERYLRQRMVMPFYPGYEGSGKWRKRYSLSNLVEVLYRFLENLGISDFDLMGHSFGTIVAAEFARKHSEMVGKLILVGAPSSECEMIRKIRKYKWVVLLARWRVGRRLVKSVATRVAMRKDKELRREILKTFEKFAKGFDQRALAEYMLEILKCDFDSHYTGLPGPTLFLYGDKDGLTPARRFGDYPLKIIGGGHRLMIDNPKEFFKAVYGFLENGG